MMENFGPLQLFIIIYKEFKFFFHAYIHKSLICAPRLHAPKIDKTMSKLLDAKTLKKVISADHEM